MSRFKYQSYSVVGSEIWHPECSDEYQREVLLLLISLFLIGTAEYIMDLGGGTERFWGADRAEGSDY